MLILSRIGGFRVVVLLQMLLWSITSCFLSGAVDAAAAVAASKPLLQCETDNAYFDSLLSYVLGSCGIAPLSCPSIDESTFLHAEGMLFPPIYEASCDCSYQSNFVRFDFRTSPSSGESSCTMMVQGISYEYDYDDPALLTGASDCVVRGCSDHPKFMVEDFCRVWANGEPCDDCSMCGDSNGDDSYSVNITATCRHTPAQPTTNCFPAVGLFYPVTATPPPSCDTNRDCNTNSTALTDAGNLKCIDHRCLPCANKGMPCTSTGGCCNSKLAAADGNNNKGLRCVIHKNKKKKKTKKSFPPPDAGGGVCTECKNNNIKCKNDGQCCSGRCRRSPGITRNGKKVCVS